LGAAGSSWVALLWALLAASYVLVQASQPSHAQYADEALQVSATGNSVPTLIGGEALIALSACTGYSYAFVSGELVPIKYRFLANAIIFAFSLPTAGFGAAISTAFILYTDAGWRWVFYFLLILNGVTCLLYFFFYHPPTLGEKHGKGHTWELIKNFDYGECLSCPSDSILR
jgi:hypothetical protein